VTGLLVIHATLCLTSLVRKSHTSDEVLFIAGGLSYWLFDDYRLGSEAGHLPLCWASLPLALMDDVRFPERGASWTDGDVWAVGHDLLYTQGNDLQAILAASRSMIVALSLMLALVIYHVSSRLFGTAGGLVSLSLYCLCPSVLAHASLATSDLAAAATFLAATVSLWWLLARITLLRLAITALAVPAMVLAKMSGLLILPLGVLLALVRLLDGRPLPVRLPRWRACLNTQGSQAAIFASVGLILAGVAAMLIWASFGFRHSAVPAGAPGQARFEQRWEALRHNGGAAVQSVSRMSDRRLLPEAYLYGLAFQFKTSGSRRAFAAGRYSLLGWGWFFPYAVLIKTPLATFGVFFLATAAVLHRLRRLPRQRRIRALRRGLYRTAPLWALGAIYWTFAVGSNLNIGHRHVLPVYVPVFVLAGAAGYWFRHGWRVPQWATAALLVVLGATAVGTWPDYLAYFNRLVGGPANGYRHLVDSSLDWGQDLPALADWLENERIAGRLDEPVYLAYFGNALPAHYGVDAILLPGVPDRRPPGMPAELTGGVYAISATLLQSTLQTPMGPWCDVYEDLYRGDRAALQRWGKAAVEDRPRIETEGELAWTARMRRFEELRLARLCASLRRRSPDGNAGHSILIYRLSDEQLRAAIDGPPVELARGIQVEAP